MHFVPNGCGKIPAQIRIGGTVRWSVQKCADWLAAGAPTRAEWEAMKRAGEYGISQGKFARAIAKARRLVQAVFGRSGRCNRPPAKTKDYQLRVYQGL